MASIKSGAGNGQSLENIMLISYAHALNNFTKVYRLSAIDLFHESYIERY